MSQHQPTPFDRITGRYIIPMPVHHSQSRRKSYLFVNGRWIEVGDIQVVLIPVDELHSFIQVQTPDVGEFANLHQDEGMADWLYWGASVN